MPSPVGHSLIGLAIGAAGLLRPGRWRDLARETWAKRWPIAGAVLLANAPDLDYIPGILSGDLNRFHHFYTHTLGWALLVSGACWLAWRSRDTAAGLKGFLLIFALLASHLVADWVTEDNRLPYGIMALWPFSDRFTISPVWIFPSVHKADWSECLELHNLRVALVEAAICLPLVIGVMAWKRLRAPRPYEP